jgi:hypothetical protein
VNTSAEIVSKIVVVPIVPSASVAEIVTDVCAKDAVGIPVTVPAVALNTSPYAVRSMEDEYVIGVAAAAEVAAN